jgi:hypothetical protein
MNARLIDFYFDPCHRNIFEVAVNKAFTESVNFPQKNVMCQAAIVNFLFI